MYEENPAGNTTLHLRNPPVVMLQSDRKLSSPSAEKIFYDTEWTGRDGEPVKHPADEGGRINIF